jgi:hypothetical protein
LARFRIGAKEGVATSWQVSRTTVEELGALLRELQAGEPKSAAGANKKKVRS